MNKCGLCGSSKISGGSWTPDRCSNCGATQFTHNGEWEYDEMARPTIEEIREKSGYPIKYIRKTGIK
jgi:hypothetical protein